MGFADDADDAALVLLYTCSCVCSLLGSTGSQKGDQYGNKRTARNKYRLWQTRSHAHRCLFGELKIIPKPSIANSDELKIDQKCHWAMKCSPPSGGRNVVESFITLCQHTDAGSFFRSKNVANSPFFNQPNGCRSVLAS